MSKKPVGCMAEAEQEAMLALLPPAEAAIFRKALATNAANAEAEAKAAAAREKLFALLSPEQTASTRKELSAIGTRGASKLGQGKSNKRGPREGGRPEMLLNAMRNGTIMDKATFDAFVKNTPVFAGYGVPFSKTKKWRQEHGITF